MTDLPEFIAARLDEDEDTAKAAQLRSPGPWEAGDNTDSPLPGAVSLYDGHDESVAVIRGSYAAAHIAHYDPARALREIAAKRAILQRHKPLTGRFGPCCTQCSADVDSHLGVPWPCEDVRLLVVAWSRHLEYDLNWLPA